MLGKGWTIELPPQLSFQFWFALVFPRLPSNSVAFYLSLGSTSIADMFHKLWDFFEVFKAEHQN